MATPLEYSDDEIEKLLNGLYSGTVTPRSLPEGLYYATARYLCKGVYKGFGIDFNELTEAIEEGIKSAFTTNDFELLTEFRENIYMFSAAKTFHQCEQMSSLLIDEDGVLRTRGDFKKDARKVFDEFNDSYLNAEYPTAVGQATMGAYWNRIEARKDELPYLQFHTIGNACQICAPMNGLTAKVNDPIWRKIMPLIHFFCFCTVDQLGPEAKETPDDEKENLYNAALGKMQPAFKMNPGIDKVIFNEHHPYFSVAQKDRGFAKTNFGLPIPTKD